MFYTFQLLFFFFFNLLVGVTDKLIFYVLF